jgi:DNA-binding transcriptional LysR family regulator
MSRHLDTDLLRAFVMVAETNSFTKASERLFRTQAAISMQIRRLEERIGKPIFVRSTHGTRLTTDGELLMHYARRILDLNDEAFANLSIPQPEDVVRIGVPNDYATILLPDVLLLFNKAFPEVQVEVVCGGGVNLVREVRDGGLDFALAIRHPESKDGELIRREPLHWITSANNSPHASDPLPLALVSNGCVCRDIALRTLKETDRSCKIVFASGSMATILAAVLAGLAVSVAEESVIPAGVRRLGEADGFPSLGTVDIVLYRAPGHQRRPAVTLADHIHLWLKRRAAPPLKFAATVGDRRGPPPAVVAKSPHTPPSSKRDVKNVANSAACRSPGLSRSRSGSTVEHEA